MYIHLREFADSMSICGVAIKRIKQEIIFVCCKVSNSPIAIRCVPRFGWVAGNAPVKTPIYVQRNILTAESRLYWWCLLTFYNSIARLPSAMLFIGLVQCVQFKATCIHAAHTHTHTSGCWRTYWMQRKVCNCFSIEFALSTHRASAPSICRKSFMGQISPTISQD